MLQEKLLGHGKHAWPMTPHALGEIPGKQVPPEQQPKQVAGLQPPPASVPEPQVPKLHEVPLWQLVQPWANLPHCVSAFPDWHAPFEQQPKQLFGLQDPPSPTGSRQTPSWHVLP
jgi:hypothetical protein